MLELPLFDHLSVISDLHMGGVPGRQMFSQGPLLGQFIDSLVSINSEAALVINGDMVDFLAEPNAVYLDPLGAGAKLERIVSDAAFNPVWTALRRYVKTPAKHLIITLGNHDLELALPWVQSQLLDLLSQGDTAARARIALAFEGAGYACRVGNAKVLCVHGNEVDTWNLTDYAALRRLVCDLVQRRNPKPWVPNAGTKLVIDVMNRVKCDHAFVDLLKPEKEAATRILLTLRPDLRPAITKAASIATTRAWDAVRHAMGLLSGEDLAESEPDPLAGIGRRPKMSATEKDNLLKRIEEQYMREEDPIEAVDEGRQLGWTAAALTALTGGDDYSVAYEAVKELTSDDTFQLHKTDDDFEKVDAMAGPDFEYLIAGHTHLARMVKRRNGRGWYYNSGTWANLMKLDKNQLASAEAFRPVFETIKGAQTVAGLGNYVLRRPTVVTVKGDGASIAKVELVGNTVKLNPL